jgi:hypothetical protein
VPVPCASVGLAADIVREGGPKSNRTHTSAEQQVLRHTALRTVLGGPQLFSNLPPLLGARTMLFHKLNQFVVFLLRGIGANMGQRLASAACHRYIRREREREHTCVHLSGLRLSLPASSIVSPLLPARSLLALLLAFVLLEVALAVSSLRSTFLLR